ncbi:hypothetical protein ABPG75_009376 [Micractinium tetrahymenae]
MSSAAAAGAPPPASPKGEPGPADSTAEELRNLAAVREYMEVAYDPARASAAAVQHLVAPDSRFIAPTTFPEIKDCLQYAQDHGELMKSVSDLRITSFDVQFAKGSWVCLRYSAEGSHSGAPHKGIPATHKRARWSAAAIFELTPDGKSSTIKTFWKDWDKLSMWSQLGWLPGEAPALE